MSVQTGIAPQELLELDGAMFDALVAAVERRWPAELELAAMLVELTHAQLLAFLRVHSKSSARLPEPLVVERPGAGEDAKPAPAPRVSIRELAELASSSADLRGAA